MNKKTNLQFCYLVGYERNCLLSQAKTDEATSRLMTVPGVGPMCATTIQAFAPPMEKFSNGREFAA